MVNGRLSLNRDSLLNQAFLVCIFFVIATPPISRAIFHTTGNSFTASFQFFVFFIALIIQVYRGKIRKGFLVFMAIFLAVTLFLVNLGSDQINEKANKSKQSQPTAAGT